MTLRLLLVAASLAILTTVPDVPGATAATLRQCRSACGARVQDECSDLSRRRTRQCRKRIVRACRRTGLAQCLPTTTTATATTTTEPTASSSTTTTTGTLPTPLCGNGVIDSGEMCDGASLGDGYCLQGGPITCLPSCAGWNYNACYHCQNGVREGLEDCDGADIGDATCPAGSTGGSPVCKSSCTLDYGPCIQCGDGNLDPGEYCDDGNTDAHDGCSPTCQSECGDGILEPPLEMCDDGANANGDGCNAFCEIPMPYAGGGSEVDDGCALQWGAASDAPLGATLTCTDGQSPCDRGPASDETCRFLVYFCVNNPSSTVACPWSGVSRVALVGDSLSGPAALDEGERTTVLHAFATALEWAGGGVSGVNPERTVTPVVTNGILCGQFALDVASGSSRAVAVQIEDGHVPAGVDVDQLTLSCTAGG